MYSMLFSFIIHNSSMYGMLRMNLEITFRKSITIKKYLYHLYIACIDNNNSMYDMYSIIFLYVFDVVSVCMVWFPGTVV